MQTLTALELKSKIDKGEDIQIIDVREDYEYDDYNIGGINIPLDRVLSSIEKINRNKPVIFVCKSGKRSKALLHTIKRKLKLDNFYSLDGGIINYQEEIGA